MGCVSVTHRRRHIPRRDFACFDWPPGLCRRFGGPSDWPRVLDAVDNPPGGVWIDFIRRTLEDSQLIVAVPVTGSLVSPTLFSRRDANCTDRSFDILHSLWHGLGLAGWVSCVAAGIR